MDNPSAPRSQGIPAIASFLMGGLIGFVAAGFLVGMASFVYIQRKVVDARKGWNLVPVVVAATDIPEGTVVTFDMLSQRQVPEQFVTSSVVKPDSANYIVNQKILVPAQAGDLMLWSQFETTKKPSVLVASRDVPVGKTLAEEDVESLGMAKEILTPSYILEQDRPQVVGKRVAAPFRKGDPILWTHFKAEPPAVGSAKDL